MPRSVTRYELIERIGVGTMAEIFRGKALAAGGFEKPVAIKRMLPHLGQDRRFVEALIAEAKILSQLRHRNIVQIFDVGLGEDGQYFLVMEFVDGMDLGGIQRTLETRRKRLPLDIALHVGAEVCEALEYAHVALAPDGTPMRLVHRAVGPSNVFISRHGEVKLTDFGLARRPGEHTGHGGGRGKFGYLSPEASEGLSVDTRSDVFSAAVLVYELALGRRLFSQLGDLDALRAVRECNVTRPLQMDPTLPPKLDEILMAALVRDPTHRTATPGEFGARLRSLRYSLESSAGDPAQELGRILAGVEAVGDGGRDPDDESSTANERGQPASGGRVRRGAAGPAGTPASAPAASGSFGREPTFVSLKPVDLFGDDRDGTGVIKARQLLDRFEEEETRLASSPGTSGGRWRQQQDTFEAPVVSGGGPRETSPTGIFLGDRVGGAPGETGEVTFTGTPDHGLDESEESTKVLSPADLARRAQPDTDERPVARAAVAPALPGVLPRARGKSAGGKTAPPPVPPARPAAPAPVARRDLPAPTSQPAAARRDLPAALVATGRGTPRPPAARVATRRGAPRSGRIGGAAAPRATRRRAGGAAAPRAPGPHPRRDAHGRRAARRRSPRRRGRRQSFTLGPAGGRGLRRDRPGQPLADHRGRHRADPRRRHRRRDPALSGAAATPLRVSADLLAMQQSMDWADQGDSVGTLPPASTTQACKVSSAA